MQLQGNGAPGCSSQTTTLPRCSQALRSHPCHPGTPHAAPPQARSLPTGSLRPAFVVMNLAVYAVQCGLWVFCSLGGETPAGTDESQLGKELSGCFLAFVSAAAAFAFLLYGGRLWLMLRRFPIESRGRRKKLREVGLVTTICATCFLFRCAWGVVGRPTVSGWFGGSWACCSLLPGLPHPASTPPYSRRFPQLACSAIPLPTPPTHLPAARSVIVAWSTFDYEDADLDVMGHPLLNIIYYSGAEIIPSALVLYILRKLPPKRQPQGYQQMPSE